jgi:hypothetical protein
MQSTDIPSRLPIPFANGAGVGFIRSIPTASQIPITDGAASLTDGFPPLCFQPIASGGVPPSGQDLNGILFRVSGWSRWQAAGGPVTFNSDFSTSIGGYPRGAFLQSTVTPGLFFVSTVENNTTNPDLGGAGWQAVVPVKASEAQVLAGTNDATFITPLRLAGLRATVGDVQAGTDNQKYVTPASLAGAVQVNTGQPGFRIEADGYKKCWGRARATYGEQQVTVGLPVAFDAPPLFGGGFAWNNNGSREIDFWVQNMTHLWTSTTISFYLNSSDGGSVFGFDWFAEGY